MTLQATVCLIFITVTEEAYLKQLAIEEWYGKKQAEKAKAEKEELYVTLYLCGQYVNGMRDSLRNQRRHHMS